MHFSAGVQEVRGKRGLTLGLRIWVDVASFKIRNTQQRSLKILLLNLLPEKLPKGNAKEIVAYMGWKSNTRVWEEDRNLKSLADVWLWKPQERMKRLTQKFQVQFVQGSLEELVKNADPWSHLPPTHTTLTLRVSRKGEAGDSYTVGQLNFKKL